MYRIEKGDHFGLKVLLEEGWFEDAFFFVLHYLPAGYYKIYKIFVVID